MSKEALVELCRVYQDRHFKMGNYWLDRIVPLVARKGRAAYLGPRSADHPDPGAASTVLLFTALRDGFRE